MFLQRSFVAVGLALALTSAVVAAPNRSALGRGRRGSSRYGIAGTVVQVHHDRLHRHAGWIKIRHGIHRSYGNRRGISARAAVSGNRSVNSGQVMTFAVNAATRFQRLGGYGSSRGGRASFSMIRTGERVRIVPGSGSQHAARRVDILANSSSRSRHRYASSHRYGTGRRVVRRQHPLVGSRVMARSNPRRYVRVNRPVVRPVVVRRVVTRPMRHTLIEGRVGARQTRQAVAARMVKHEIKQTVKHEAKNHKAMPPKHTAPPKHNPPKHSTPPKHSSGHRKR